MENQNDLFRREPPAPLAPRTLNVPTPDEVTLDNGLLVVFVERSRLPLANFRLALRTGDSYDPPDLPGLTDLMSDMLFEGTQTRTSREIAEAVARYGASLSGGAGSDYTTVAASSLSTYAGEVLELLADVALHPSFPEDELELAKENAQQNLIAQRAQPSFLAAERLARVVFGEHPYGTISPTPESIAALTREKIESFHRSVFVPNNAVLFVSGNVERGPMLERINQLFGEWQRGETPEPQFPALPSRDSRSLYLIDRPGSAQSNIIIANLAITRRHPDYFPMLVMHTVLGANASSRLFMNLREEKGYTYGAYTTLDARRFAGTFRASAEVRAPVTGASLAEFFREFDRIRTEDVSEKELNNAKSYLTGIFPIRLETQEGLIDQLVQIKMHGLPGDYLSFYRERIQQVSIEDVRRMANAYITPERAAVVVVGDAASIEEQVRPFAAHVELYDSAGRLKGTAGYGVSDEDSLAAEAHETK